MKFKTFYGWKSSGLAICEYLEKGDYVDDAIIRYLAEGILPEDNENSCLMLRIDSYKDEFMIFQRSRGRWAYSGLITQSTERLPMIA